MLGKVIQRTTNARPMRVIRHAPGKYFILYAHIYHVYSLVPVNTLERKLKIFVAYLFEYQAIECIDDTSICMEGHFVT